MIWLLAALAAEVPVGPATWHPAFPLTPEQTSVEVAAFRIDETPVTEGQMLAFVKAHPEWRRDRVPKIKADEGYLSHWASPDQLGAQVGPDQPATHVSWFAARAYCAAQGQRLPLEAEWELAAAASATQKDAVRDPDFVASLLQWYSTRSAESLPDVGGPANIWGVRDLHGLVWEWVEDYNAALVTADNREQGKTDRQMFCGGGATAAANPSDYAAFMRYAYRSSLRASYTTRNLGFRCASDN